jgi:hypothetical protein
MWHDAAPLVDCMRAICGEGGNEPLKSTHTCRRELSVLLSEYLKPGATARLNFVPPSDNRLLTSVNVRLPEVLRKGWGAFLSDGPGTSGVGDTWADLCVRAHLTKDDPHSFAALVVGSTHVRH